MGCTSSRSQVVVTNAIRHEERPVVSDGQKRDVNNNDGNANIPVKTDNESQTQNDNELSQSKDVQLEGKIDGSDSREDQDPNFVVAKKEDNIDQSSQPSPHHGSKDESQPTQKTEKLIEKTGKYQLFSSVDEFRDVDQHALQAPKEKASSFEELASYLADPYSSDLYKARSLWRWITSNIAYDTDAFFSNNISLAADERNALQTGKAVCSGYSSLVSALCSCIGLECKEIHGYAKGYSYHIGDSFNGVETNHSWTAIKIQGHWWLFDFTWGSGYVGKDKEFVWDYNEHYFMTDPELFILDHYPKDDEWQLIEGKYPLEEYEKWAKFSKHYFIHQLGKSSHKNGLIVSDDGNVEVSLGTNVPVQISSKLEFIENNTIKALSDHSFTYVKGDTAFFSARLPNLGHYYLNLYASKLSSDTHKSYDLVVKYQIECTKPCPDFKPFPKTFSNWLPGYILHEPIDGVLQKQRSYKFCIEAPDVVEMHISTTGGDGNWTALAESRRGLWEGDVIFSDSTVGATVVVKVEGQTSTTFSGILKYDIK